MIAENTFRVSSPTGEFPSLYLGPYGTKELRPYVPVRPETLPHEQLETLDIYAGSPEDLLELEEKLLYMTSWGIFEKERSPSAFVGIIDLSQSCAEKDGREVYTAVEMAVGTTIFCEARRGKGIGTLAKLAMTEVMRVALETHVFRAGTSNKNMGAQASLSKTGFVCTGRVDEAVLADGGTCEEWLMADVPGQTALYEGEFVTSKLLEELEDGWARNRRQVATLAIEEV